MNRKTLKRLLASLGVTAGFIAVTATQASAAMNHTEPVLGRKSAP